MYGRPGSPDPGHPRSESLPFEVLVPQAKKEDDAEDDGGEKDLADVVVKNLLIGVRGVVEDRFFVARCFTGDD